MRTVTTCVYVDLEGTPHFVGRLHSRIRGDRERATLEYVNGWRENREAFALSPALRVDYGAHHTRGDRAIFAPLTDSAPDRWGRELIARRERQVATEEGRNPRTLFEIDYLLLVSDVSRQGALRFAAEEGGPFLAHRDEDHIPPLVELPRLLRASDRILAHTDTPDDLRLLLAPGSSLGGARPKASVRDEGGSLMIAKFPARSDEWDVVRWEAVALSLARDAGVDVPAWRVLTVGEAAVLALERFDRQGRVRRPYLSALGMLGAMDHDTRSYAEVADAIRRHGASPDEDLAALWRRLVFNILMSNTDDHLRNHGFLYERPRGWRLAPAFDLNPTPRDVKPHVLSTPVWIDGDSTASLEIALEHASYFRLAEAEARALIAEVGVAVGEWRHVAARHGLSEAEIGRMSSAFEHEEMEHARAL